MDYYASLNSASQQNSALDYANQQLLTSGTQNYEQEIAEFQNEFSKQITDINAEFQGKVAEITGAFARKDTAQEQLVSALEGAGGALEITKSAKKGYDKYKGDFDKFKDKLEETKDNIADKVKSSTKTDEVMASADEEQITRPQVGSEIELRNITSTPSSTTTAPATEMEGIDVPRGTYSSPFLERSEPREPLVEGAGEGAEAEASVGAEAEASVEAGAEAGAEAGTAVALEETAGEIAVAGAFDPVVDAVAGGLMLAGVGVGVFDLLTKKKTEKKIKKKQDKAEADAQEAQNQAQEAYDAQVKGTNIAYNNIRNNITANTHAGVAIGVQNIRNTYKSGGTF